MVWTLHAHTNGMIDDGRSELMALVEQCGSQVGAHTEAVF